MDFLLILYAENGRIFMKPGEMILTIRFQEQKLLLASGTRFSQAVQEILRSSEGDIAIIAHTGCISSYLYMLHPGTNTRQHFRLPCGSYYHLRVDEKGNAALSESGYILPHPVLSDRLCYILRDAVSLPPHVQVHSDAVTELACHLCDELEAHGHHFDQKHHPLRCTSS